MALLTKIKTRLAIHAHRRVRSLLDGEYASIQLGRSLDFNDLREYVVGDDVKDLDWKSSARHGSLLVKRYLADRKHTLLLCVCTGPSMTAQATADTTKADLVIFVAGLLGYLATRHGDLVGLVAGSTDTVRSIRPRGSELHLERLLRQVLDQISAPAEVGPTASDERRGSDLAAVLDHVARTVRRRTITVVISDDVELGGAEQAQLRRLRAQHEILFVTVADLDPTDEQLVGSLVDVGTGSGLPDFLRGDPELHAELVEATQARAERRRTALERLGIAGELVASEDHCVPAIHRLLDRHRHAAA